MTRVSVLHNTLGEKAVVVTLELISGYWWISHVFDGENGAKKKKNV